jgi:hypothetical protein
MITRTMDATFLNEVANHPEVRPFVGPGSEPLDLMALLSDPENVALQAEHGGWLLICLSPGVYELHTVFLPAGRGAEYFAAAHEALRWMFTRTDCLEILTRCPDDNPAARMAAVKVGFRERFRREDVWQSGLGEACGASYQALTVDDWMKRDPAIAYVGHDFHVTLENEKLVRSAESPVHPEDEAHDRAVGACFLMAQHGQMNKAVGVYNRWARFAGYAQITMLSPTILDIADALLEVIDGEMKVLGVR